MKKTAFLVAATLLSMPAANAAVVTKISGCVADTAIQVVTFIKEGQHPMMSPSTKVPVKDGKFYHEIESEYPVGYYVVPGTQIWMLNGDWFFFSEEGTVDVDIRPGKDVPAVKLTTSMPETVKLHKFWAEIDGDPEYKAYEAFADSVYDNNLYYTPEYDRIQNEMNESGDEEFRKQAADRLDSLAKAGLKLTPDGRKVDEWGERVASTWKTRELDFTANDGSLCGLFKIIRNMWMPTAENHEKYIELYENIYRDKFAGHPYTAEIERIMPVYRGEVATVGTKYIDVEALDENGKMRPISDFINGKVAIIDFWASWCGPCRRNSKAMIPLYDKYASKGLAVIGLAREMKDDKALRAAIKKDGYPWPSLAEINDVNFIWTRYGTPNAPGRVVLVDRNGIIQAIDPDLATLESKLAELLE